MNQERYDALVVGAGVVGCATAYHLTKAGLRVALLDKGSVAGEASQAGAGMLAPLAEAGTSGQDHPFLRLCLAGLRYYDGLDRQLKDETGTEIELVDAPTLRPAFSEHEVEELQTEMQVQQHLLPGLQWLEGKVAREVEPLLPPTVQGAILSPWERNVQISRITLAYARGAALGGTQIFEGRSVGRFIRQGQRVVGVQTTVGPVLAEIVVLAAGAWAATWHARTEKPPIFPVKGQMVALRAAPHIRLRHTIFSHKLGYLLPKADGSIYVGSTSELTGFDKTVTVEGVAALLTSAMEIAPGLKTARFERAWAGLRPGSADNLPLIGSSRSMPGLWIAGGHFRNGILLGPLTGHILSELIQGRPAPFGLDLSAFDPDRFGGWDGYCQDIDRDRL
jgi:glycine oxidase